MRCLYAELGEMRHALLSRVRQIPAEGNLEAVAEMVGAIAPGLPKPASLNCSSAPISARLYSSVTSSSLRSGRGCCRHGNVAKAECRFLALIYPMLGGLAFGEGTNLPVPDPAHGGDAGIGAAQKL